MINTFFFSPTFFNPRNFSFSTPKTLNPFKNRITREENKKREYRMKLPFVTQVESGTIKIRNSSTEFGILYSQTQDPLIIIVKKSI